MAVSQYSYESNISAPGPDVFEYHERPSALQRLTPPWESVKIVEKTGGIENGGTLDIEMKIGFIKTRWKSRHTDYSKGQQFADYQVSGPFSSWRHLHSFRSIGPLTTNLKDSIQFELPFGNLGHWLANNRMKRRLNRLFTFRHMVTENDLSHWMLFRANPRRKVAITGGNGLIGSALAVFLAAQGHEVVILSRSGNSRVFGIPGVKWDPEKRTIDSESLADVNCWIHLAGENLASGRWTDERVKQLKESRVEGTKFLVDFISALKNPPESFICASGIGYYGSSSGTLTESSPKGSGILADICESWEDASKKLETCGIRRVLIRTGVVLSPTGGALAKLLPLFKLGLGGKIGSGKQHWSWIAMDDLLQIYDTAIQDPQLSGVINATAPIPVTNHEFSKILGSTLNRPAVIPAPAWPLKILLGRMADEALLADQNVLPERLTDQEFVFNFPELELALSHCLGVY